MLLQLASYFRQRTIFVRLSLVFLLVSWPAAARPGASSSRSASVKRPPPTTPGVIYRLSDTLLTPRIHEMQYQAYIDELPNSLQRLGYRSARVSDVPMSYTELLSIQDLVRAQMASGGKKKQFIPILHAPGWHGQGKPVKVYAMPLDGTDYSQRDIRDYAGRNGRQKLVVLGTLKDPHIAIGPPLVEIYGVADATGAPSLHSHVKKISSRYPQAHNLAEFLDLNNIAPGTPIIPRPVHAAIEHGVTVL